MGATKDTRSFPFTRYLRALEGDDESEQELAWNETWQALRHALRRDLQRRGLWQLSPVYLGLIGWQSWWRVGDSHDDPLEEIAGDIYRYIFIDRLDALRAHLRLKDNIDGLVYRNVSNFLTDLQRRHDPIGDRIFRLLRSVVTKLEETGEVVRPEASTPLGRGTSFVFPNGEERAGEPDLASLENEVRSWPNSLLPELLLARGVARQELKQKVATRVLSLEEAGIGSFTLGEVARYLVQATRSWWANLLPLSREVVSGDGENGENSENQAPADLLLMPGENLEARRRLARLIACVTRGLRGSSGPTMTPKTAQTLEEARRLWDLLLAWSLDRETPLSSEDPSRVPSQLFLGRVLDWPRDRVRRRLASLASIVENCRQRESEVGRAAARPSNRRGEVMPTPADHHRRLRNETIAALRTSQRGSEPPTGPKPGDLYLFEATRDWDFEWLVIGAPEGDDGSIPVVAVDTLPFLGPQDVPWTSNEAAGPVTLRCAVVVSVSASAFRSELRAGQVSAGAAEAAREANQQGVLSENDDGQEPDLKAHRVHLETAIAALPTPIESRSKSSSSLEAEAKPTSLSDFKASRHPGRDLRTWRQIAAAAALVALFAGAWAWMTQQRLETAFGPTLTTTVKPMDFPGPSRDPEAWQPPPEGELLLVNLRGLEKFDCQPLRIQIQDSSKGVLWQSPAIDARPDGQSVLSLSRDFFAKQPAYLVILGECVAPLRELERRPLARF